MKKIKKIVAGILVLSLLFLCSACMMQGKKDDNSKWVMTKQTKSTVNEQGTEKLIYEIDYKYDSYGRKNYEIWSIMPGSTYVYSDFEYDGNGNVVSCKHNYKDEVFNINENSDCTYVYDNNNNLIKSTVSGTSSIDITTYKYDEKGNLICAEYSWTDTQYQDEDNVTHNYSLIYENDICVSAEVIIDSSSSEKQTYCLYNYSYDENGNKISEHQYKEVEDSSQGEIIEFNGKSYGLENIIKYTYEQIEIESLNDNSNVENNYNSDNENDFFEKEEPTVKSTPLSEWGFNNIDEWGGKLVEVQTTDEGNFIFDERNGKGTFVIVREGTHFLELYSSSNQLLSSSFYFSGPSSSDAGVYHVLDNDTVSAQIYGDFSGALRIVDRKIVNDTIMFAISDGYGDNEYYIPYMFVNRSVKEELARDVEDSKYDFYKAYLK